MDKNITHEQNNTCLCLLLKKGAKSTTTKRKLKEKQLKHTSFCT